MAGRLPKLPKGIKHSVWAVFDAVLYPMVYMLMVPVLMNGLGVAAFGVWVVLNTLMTTLQLFNLNIGLTTIRKVSFYAAQNDQEKLNLAVSAIVRITLFLLVFVLILGTIITFVIPYRNFLGITESLSGGVTLSIILASLITGLKYFDQVFQGVLKAFELFRLAAILNLFNRIGLLLLTVGLAVSDASVVQLLSANVLFTTVYLFVHFLAIRKSLPSLKISLVKGQELKRSILSFSKWPWLQSIIVVIAFQTDRFWVSAFSGVEEVSSYGLVATMFNHIHMTFLAVAAWIFPRISGMAAKGDDPGRIFSSVRGLLLTIVIAGLMVFYLSSTPLFDLWVGKEISLSMQPYIRSFTAFELLFAQTIMPFFYLNATGRERTATYTTLLYSGSCYLLMLAGLFVFQHPVYMVHGMTLALCGTMPVLNYMVSKTMDKPLSVRHTLIEMLPTYLSVVVIYLSETWIAIALIPVIAILLFRKYLSPVMQQNIWKQPVKL